MFVPAAIATRRAPFRQPNLHTTATAILARPHVLFDSSMRLAPVSGDHAMDYLESSRIVHGSVCSRLHRSNGSSHAALIGIVSLVSTESQQNKMTIPSINGVFVVLASVVACAGQSHEYVQPAPYPYRSSNDMLLAGPPSTAFFA